MIAVTDDWHHRVVVIDPRTKRIVWQYGHLGVASSAPGYLSKPDGLDLLPARTQVARSPQQGAAVHARMNYPYLHTWKELLSGKAPSFARYAPELPLLFVYGGRKPARFHTERWADFVRSRPGNEVI